MSQELLRIKVEPASLMRKKLLLMLIGIIPFIYVGFAGGLRLIGEKGPFVRDLWKYFPYVFIVALVIATAAVCLHWFYRSTLTITATFKGELQIRIQTPAGRELFGSGTWGNTAFYKKEYHKLGAYRKDLFLTLYCNNKIFCVLRYKTAAAASAPEGFMESSAAEAFSFSRSAPQFFTPEVERIFRIIEKTAKAATEKSGQYSRH